MLQPLQRSIDAVEIAAPSEEIPHIRVGVDRDGRLNVLNGRHRLAIARLLETPRSPCGSSCATSVCAAFRELLEDHARRRWRARIYQAIDHPDLAHLRSGHGRLDVIRAALGERASWKRKSLLDLGTHWRYWPQQMSKLGFDCVGIEFKPDNADIAERLAPPTESSYTVRRGDLTEYPDPEADVTLALSIFHHRITTEELHIRLVDFLGRRSTGIMLFEPPNLKATAKGPQNTYRKYQPEAFVRFVAEHSGLDQIEKLGIADRRTIYKLAKARKIRRPPRSEEEIAEARRDKQQARKERALAASRERREREGVARRRAKRAAQAKRERKARS